MTTTLITADDLFQRVNHVIPSIEWATMTDDVDAILAFRKTQGYVGDTALLLTQALLAAFDDGSDTITTAHLDDVALSARAAAGEADLRKAPAAPSRRRSLKVTVT